MQLKGIGEGLPLYKAATVYSVSVLNGSLLLSSNFVFTNGCCVTE